MVLKPQDILVLLKLISVGKRDWSYNSLSVSLGMSPSEVHAAVRRSLTAGLAVRHDDTIFPNIRNLEEFLIHGLKYVFVPDRGEMSRGIPTLYAADPLKGKFSNTDEPPPLWPDPTGTARGMIFSPLYKSVPKAAREDQVLYELLVLIDALRGGRARERAMAEAEIKNRLKAYEKSKS
jgi:hypothetical protein